MARGVEIGQNAGGASGGNNGGTDTAQGAGPVPGAAPYQNTRDEYAGYTPDWDHTDEFDSRDVHDNKVVVMIMYLSGLYGTLICFAILWLVGKSKSNYLAFHVRENFKITLINTLLGLFSLVFFWKDKVIRFICFVGAARNQSKEVAIIRNFGFLR